jgi:hypothetical protein
MVQLGESNPQIVPDWGLRSNGSEDLNGCLDQDHLYPAAGDSARTPSNREQLASCV